MNLRVGKTRNSRYVFSDCFALPTVLISSIIMLSVLLSTAVMTTSTRVALKNQLNNRLSKLAGEAGEAYAEACLDRNNGISSWTETKPLKPDTDCNGTQLSGINCPGNHDLCSLSSNNGGKSKSIFSIGLKDTPPPKQWKMISTGDDHNCSISSGDKIFCWGGNHSGQLGDGTTIGRHVPIEVKFDEAHVDEDVVLVSAGGSHTCAITAEIINNLYCWGNNSNGQLGTNSQTESHTDLVA